MGLCLSFRNEFGYISSLDQGEIASDQIRREPDAGDLDPTRVTGPGMEHQARLERSQRHGHIRLHRRRTHRARLALDAGGDVDRDHRHGCLVERFDRVGRGALGPPPKTRSEHRVDGHVGPRHLPFHDAGRKGKAPASGFFESAEVARRHAPNGTAFGQKQHRHAESPPL